MSERWKFQIKNGVFWALFMAFIMSIPFDLIDWANLKYLTFEKAFLLSKLFLFKFLFWILPGIFIIGYFDWKQKKKREKIDEQ